MSIGYFIASASGWDDRRKASVDRVMLSLAGLDVTTVVSYVREHSSVWATRLYQRAIESKHDHFVFLNDDVVPCPKFGRVVDAMIEAVPDQVISLATICSEASEEHSHAWLRSYLLTGPAYIYHRYDLELLVKFRSELPARYRDGMNEDEVAVHHAWYRQKPILQSLPAMVTHDTSVPSTLGYDHHANRVTTAKMSDGSETDPKYWRIEHAKEGLCENPWMPVSRMIAVRRSIIRGDNDYTCTFCRERDGFFTSAKTGAGICTMCIRQINDHVFENLRAG